MAIGVNRRYLVRKSRVILGVISPTKIDDGRRNSFALGTTRFGSRAVAIRTRVFYHFPLTFTSEAHMIVDGMSSYGHARLHFFLIDSGHGWQVQSTWWEHPGTPTPETVIAEPY